MRITERRFKRIIDAMGFTMHGYLGRFAHKDIPNTSYGLVLNRWGNPDYFKTARRLLHALNDARGNDDATMIVRGVLQDMERTRRPTSNG